MSFSEIAAIMRRHLIAVVVIFAVTVSVAWEFKRTPPPYTESVNIIFTPPSSNPYSSFSNFPQVLLSTAEIMTKSMLSSESKKAILRAGGTASFSVGLVNFNNEQFPYYDDPYVTVSATATDPATAHQTFTILVSYFQRLVSEKQVQTGASPKSYISTHAVADTGVIAEAGSSKRVYAGLIALAVIMAFLVVTFLDRHPIWPNIRRHLAKYSPSSVRSAGP